MQLEIVMAYESRHLSLEEQWFAREHPFDITVVKVKKATKELEELEQQAELCRERLQQAVEEMNSRRTAPPTEAPPPPKPVARRIVRGSF